MSNISNEYRVTKCYTDEENRATLTLSIHVRADDHLKASAQADDFVRHEVGISLNDWKTIKCMVQNPEQIELGDFENML